MSQRAGVMRRLRGGGWAFLSTRADGMGRVALIMLPCTRLTEMARLVDASPDAIGFEVSGQVFAYHGRNYLLPTRFRTASVDSMESESVTDSTTQAPTDTDAAPDLMGTPETPLTEPTIDDLLAAIEDRSSSSPSPELEPEPLPDDSTAGGRGLPLLREGMVLYGRTGRLRPAATSAGSGWMLVGDADADTSDDLLASVPLILMPCQNLSGMERLVQEHGDTLRFSVSGVVHVYDGQNHLLPTMYLVELDRSGNLTSAQ